MPLQQYLDKPSVAEKEIQGDVLIGLQKRAEVFTFFEIFDPAAFKEKFKSVVHLITSLETTRLYETNVQGPSKSPLGEPLDKMNLAFTYAGLKSLGLITTDQGLDPAFVAGQHARAVALGDDPTNWHTAYDEAVPIHGVILSASFQTAGAEAALVIALANAQSTIDALGKGVRLLHQEIGKVRSGVGARGVPQAGHEHFGFADGVSQPGVDGLSAPQTSDVTKGFPGQDLVAPGEFVFGDYKNEHGTESTPPQEWMKNGSYMVFRRLNQDVDAFRKYVSDDWKGLATSPDQFAARVIGRWPDGSPVVRNPAFPNSGETEAFPMSNNDFDFGPPNSAHTATDLNQARCPFASHIRRMYMRSDAANDASEKHRILRAGIAFGDDDSEDKGLLFVCYQTSIENQFEFIQKLASSKDPTQGSPSLPFDPGMNAPAGGVGTDLVLASQASSRQGVWPTGTTPKAPAFVIATGGAYLFMPSLHVLRSL